MADRLTDLILSLTPEVGSSIGNNAMLARLREHVPDLEDADYAAAHDELVAAGLLRRGKGRGGSIIRVGAAHDDGGAEGDVERHGPGARDQGDRQLPEQGQARCPGRMGQGNQYDRRLRTMGVGRRIRAQRSAGHRHEACGCF